MNCSLNQVFLGQFVDVGDTIIEPMLMDFTESKGFHFFYVLPLSDGTVLFETTHFTTKDISNEILRAELEHYIKKISPDKHRLIREEVGAIPMTTRLENNKSTNKRIHQIGICSGITRSSTGYTFINIQRQSEYYTSRILGSSFANFFQTFRWKTLRLMDAVVLTMIVENPTIAKRMIYKMFELIDSQSLIRFLTDIPKLKDLMSIVLKLPKLIFLKYAFKSAIRTKI